MIYGPRTSSLTPHRTSSLTRTNSSCSTTMYSTTAHRSCPIPWTRCRRVSHRKRCGQRAWTYCQLHSLPYQCAPPRATTRACTWTRTCSTTRLRRHRQAISTVWSVQSKRFSNEHETIHPYSGPTCTDTCRRTAHGVRTSKRHPHPPPRLVLTSTPRRPSTTSPCNPISFTHSSLTRRCLSVTSPHTACATGIMVRRVSCPSATRWQ